MTYRESTVILIVCQSLLLISILCDKPKPRHKPPPTMTQAQIERDAAIDFAIYYTLNIEARLQRLERLRPLLPEVRQ